MNTEEELLDAFMSEPSTGCLLWTRARRGGAKNKYGAVAWRGKIWDTHRLMWTLKRGPIPEGMHVLHKCDTPPCGNPDHLFLGFQSDNNRDAARKGRNAYGEHHGRRKLTADQVREIRNMTQPREQIAEMFGVSREHVGLIQRGGTWKRIL